MKNKNIIILILILATAIFFRLWQLNQIPPGLYPDVAINGNDALETLRTHDFKLFYPENNGREGLFFWLISISFLIFGASVWSIKIVAAIIGILTVLGTYLVSKEIFKLANDKQLINKSEAIALIASFLIATSFWHTLFSRLGFRAIMLPFVLVFGFYFLFKGLRKGLEKKKNIMELIISGIFFGMGFYTYISYRLIVLLVPFVLLTWLLIYFKEKLQKKYWISITVYLIFIFITALPIGIYFLNNMQDFIGRAAPISVFASQNPVMEFLKSLIIHLGMFNVYGDANWRHNFSGSPMLPWPIGILFLIGIIYSIKEFILSIKNRNHNNLIVYLLLIGWFKVMLLPGALTTEGMPHALRVIGVIPVVYIFSAMGAVILFNLLSEKIKNKKILIVLSLTFLLITAGSEFKKYFFDWAGNPNVQGAFTVNYYDLGNYLNTLPDDVQKYVIINEGGVRVPYPDGLPMPAQTPMFIESTKYGKPRSTYLTRDQLDKINPDGKKTIIAPLIKDDGLFEDLKNRFPGKIEKVNNLYIYEINF